MVLAPQSMDVVTPMVLVSQPLPSCECNDPFFGAVCAYSERGQQLATLTGHTNDVMTLTYDAPNNLLFSGSNDNSIKIWRIGDDGTSGSNVATLTGHTSDVWTLTYDAPNNLLFSGSFDDSIKIWRA